MGELKHAFNTLQQIKDKEYTIIEIVQNLTSADTVELYKSAFLDSTKPAKVNFHLLIESIITSNQEEYIQLSKRQSTMETYTILENIQPYATTAAIMP